MWVVFAIEIHFSGRLQNQAVGQQNVVFALEPQRGLASLAQIGGGLRFEVVERHALQPKCRPGLGGARFEVLSHTTDHVPPRADGVSPERLKLSVFGYTIGSLALAA
ncbi:hypothetical protein D9M71_642860 [compost metagenome]